MATLEPEGVAEIRRAYVAQMACDVTDGARKQGTTQAVYSLREQRAKMNREIKKTEAQKRREYIANRRRDFRMEKPHQKKQFDWSEFSNAAQADKDVEDATAKLLSDFGVPDPEVGEVDAGLVQTDEQYDAAHLAKALEEEDSRKVLLEENEKRWYQPRKLEDVATLVTRRQTVLTDVVLQKAAVLLHSQQQHHSLLHTLDLTAQQIGDSGLEQLIPSLRRSPIVKIVLTENGIGDKGVSKLAGCLRSMHDFRELFLDHNDVTDTGVGALCDERWYSPTLQVLSLRYNLLTVMAARQLAFMMHFDHAKIRALQLGGRRQHKYQLGNTGVAILMNALIHRDCCPLKRLVLVDAGISYDGIAAVAAYMMTTDSLQELALNNNAIDEEGVKRLEEAMLVNTSIRQLILRYCGIDPIKLRRLYKLVHEKEPISWDKKKSLAFSGYIRCSNLSRFADGLEYQLIMSGEAKEVRVDPVMFGPFSARKKESKPIVLSRPKAEQGAVWSENDKGFLVMEDGLDFPIKAPLQRLVLRSPRVAWAAHQRVAAALAVGTSEPVVRPGMRMQNLSPQLVAAKAAYKAVGGKNLQVDTRVLERWVLHAVMRGPRHEEMQSIREQEQERAIRELHEKEESEREEQENSNTALGFVDDGGGVRRSRMRSSHFPSDPDPDMELVLRAPAFKTFGLSMEDYIRKHVDDIKEKSHAEAERAIEEMVLSRTASRNRRSKAPGTGSRKRTRSSATNDSRSLTEDAASSILQQDPADIAFAEVRQSLSLSGGSGSIAGSLRSKTSKKGAAATRRLPPLAPENEKKKKRRRSAKQRGGENGGGGVTARRKSRSQTSGDGTGTGTGTNTEIEERDEEGEEEEEEAEKIHAADANFLHYGMPLTKLFVRLRTPQQEDERVQALRDKRAQQREQEQLRRGISGAADGGKLMPTPLRAPADPNEFRSEALKAQERSPRALPTPPGAIIGAAAAVEDTPGSSAIGGNDGEEETPADVSGASVSSLGDPELGHTHGDSHARRISVNTSGLQDAMDKDTNDQAPPSWADWEGRSHVPLLASARLVMANAVAVGKLQNASEASDYMEQAMLERFRALGESDPELELAVLMKTATQMDPEDMADPRVLPKALLDRIREQLFGMDDPEQVRVVATWEAHANELTGLGHFADDLMRDERRAEADEIKDITHGEQATFEEAIAAAKRVAEEEDANRAATAPPGPDTSPDSDDEAAHLQAQKEQAETAGAPATDAALSAPPTAAGSSAAAQAEDSLADNAPAAVTGLDHEPSPAEALGMVVPSSRPSSSDAAATSPSSGKKGIVELKQERGEGQPASPGAADRTLGLDRERVAEVEEGADGGVEGDQLYERRPSVLPARRHSSIGGSTRYSRLVEVHPEHLNVSDARVMGGPETPFPPSPRSAYKLPNPRNRRASLLLDTHHRHRALRALEFAKTRGAGVWMPPALDIWTTFRQSFSRRRTTDMRQDGSRFMAGQSRTEAVLTGIRRLYTRWENSANPDNFFQVPLDREQEAALAIMSGTKDSLLFQLQRAEDCFRGSSNTFRRIMAAERETFGQLNYADKKLHRAEFRFLRVRRFMSALAMRYRRLKREQAEQQSKQGTEEEVDAQTVATTEHDLESISRRIDGDATELAVSQVALERSAKELRALQLTKAREAQECTYDSERLLMSCEDVSSLAKSTSDILRLLVAMHMERHKACTLCMSPDPEVTLARTFGVAAFLVHDVVKHRVATSTSLLRSKKRADQDEEVEEVEYKRPYGRITDEKGLVVHKHGLPYDAQEREAYEWRAEQLVEPVTTVWTDGQLHPNRRKPRFWSRHPYEFRPNKKHRNRMRGQGVILDIFPRSQIKRVRHPSINAIDEAAALAAQREAEAEAAAAVSDGAGEANHSSDGDGAAEGKEEKIETGPPDGDGTQPNDAPAQPPQASDPVASNGEHEVAQEVEEETGGDVAVDVDEDVDEEAEEAKKQARIKLSENDLWDR